MKRIAIFAAALTAFAPAAFAATELTSAEVYELRQYAPSADVSNLTAAQVGAISNVLTSGDTNIGAQIYSILN